MTDRMIDVQGRCPACGLTTLFVGDGGYITCSNVDCPRPDLVNELIGEIADARNHRAYTFCSQLVGHVTMTAFAKKITEKVTAVAHRKEAVAYANEQKQRAERAEAAIARIRAIAANSFMAGPNAVDVVRVADVLAALDEPQED